MKQLGILDSAFINLEQSNTPQHIGGLGIYDPSTADDGIVRFKDIISNFERRLSAQTLYRTRLLTVPGGLDRPYWVKDENFDVEFHLRHVALPRPGDWRQLCIQIARLHSRPLDMSRPLWEVYIIEGLDNMPHLPEGSFAVYTKMHHALVDGAAGTSFMELLHDRSASQKEDREPESVAAHLVDCNVSTSELLYKASVNGVMNGLGLMKGTAQTLGRASKYALQIANKEISTPEMAAPKTRFNRSVGPYRVFDAVEFSLESFNVIKQATGVTLNDVALGVVGGALQAYLTTKGEAPEASLAATLPLDMRRRVGVTGDNNQVGAVFASLHSDISNPIERLRAVHQSTLEAKNQSQHSPMVGILQIAGVLPPVISKAAAGIWSRNHLSRHLFLNVSTVISNVTGPPFPLYCAGARMVDYYGLGVLSPGLGIFHLVFSYAGKLTLSVLADRDIMPDPELYRKCLEHSFTELKKASETLEKTSTTRRKPKPNVKTKRKRASRKNA